MNIKLQYLDNLSGIISVDTLAVSTTKEHLKIPPILVNRFPLFLLPPLRYISLTDPVKKKHYHPFVTVLWLECRPLFPSLKLVATPVSCQLN
jgi:hypothetical protein